MVDRISSRRIEWRLFVAAWLAYAFFHQGGGWNQNAKFATVRAVVEQGTFSLDSYLFYSSADDTENGFRFVRTPMIEGTFGLRDRIYAVTWPGTDDLPVRGFSGDEPPMSTHRVAATGDLAYANGRFYPNKPPGAAMLGVPAYFVLHGVERLAGLDPDDWWALTVNAWLTTAFSVGLISALGCVVFFRCALLLWGGRLSEATWTTIAFAFATLVFPYATLLYEHNIVATLLLSAFYFVLRSRESPDSRWARLILILAGAAAGYSVITAYSALVPVVALWVYACFRSGRKHGWLWFGLGLIGPGLVLICYNWTYFDSAFTTHYAFQNPLFQEAGTFVTPPGTTQLVRLAALLASPFRGLFFSSPVLLVGLAGWVALWRDGKRAEVVLTGSMLAYWLVFNACLIRWDGGWGVGPRFLIPALPFLALGVTYGFVRAFKTTLILTTLSAVTMACFVTVDPQSPVGVGFLARNPGRATLLREPLTEYALPILFAGKAWPLLNAQIDEAAEQAEEQLTEKGEPADEVRTRVDAFRGRMERSVKRDGRYFTLALFIGPVSANPVGIYERQLGHVFQQGESQLDWNSFNAGELVLSGAWSLLLLAMLWLPLVGSALDVARTLDRRAAGSPAERGYQ
jgi:hypothetical protein